MSDTFWTAVKQQLAELREAKSADDVIRILSPERNPYRLDNPSWDGMDGGADGFFAGSGGNDSVWDALDDAGWDTVWSKSGIWYAMRAPGSGFSTAADLPKGTRVIRADGRRGTVNGLDVGRVTLPDHENFGREYVGVDWDAVEGDMGCGRRGRPFIDELWADPANTMITYCEGDIYRGDRR